MDCARIDLIAYHFGSSDEEAQAAAEKHLLSCTGCLEAYLALKRASERRERGDEGPSPELRSRLRRDVQRAFPAPSPWRPLAWLARPIPLYQGLAAATLALLVAAFAPSLAHRAYGPARSPELRGEQVDTSRRSAESLTIY
jgi:hypothetical protein